MSRQRLEGSERFNGSARQRSESIGFPNAARFGTILVMTPLFSHCSPAAALASSCRGEGSPEALPTSPGTSRFYSSTLTTLSLCRRGRTFWLRRSLSQEKYDRKHAGDSMFESNFPVDKGTCSYQVLWNTFKRIAAGYSADEKTALFSGAASKAYRLTV